MKTNFRDKFRDFLAFEEGQVGAKAPLALGIASGSLLLTQAILAPSAQGDFACDLGGCPEGEVCVFWCDDWSVGCDCCAGHWHSQCEAIDH